MELHEALDRVSDLADLSKAFSLSPAAMRAHARESEVAADFLEESVFAEPGDVARQIKQIAARQRDIASTVRKMAGLVEILLSGGDDTETAP